VFRNVGMGVNFAMPAVVRKSPGLFAKSKPPTHITLEHLRELRRTVLVLRKPGCTI